MLFPRRRSARPARLSGAGASPFALDAAALPAAALRALQGQTVFFDGVFKGDYSLAVVNRHLVRALLRQGLRVTCHSPEDGWYGDAKLNDMPDVRARMVDRYPAKGSFDIHLRNTWPPETADMVGRVNAYVCFAWEEIEVPSYIIERFSRDLDLLMVTSNFVRDAFIHSGLEIPVLVVGNGCDHILETVAADRPPIPLRGRRRLLHVSSCLPRKGADLLLRAFAKTFSGDDSVELVIKTYPNPENRVEQQLAEVAAAFPRMAPVEIATQSLTLPELAALYRSADLLVAPSRGEGFGLPFAEAMLHGVPVAATDYSGQRDFCSAETCYPIAYHLVPSAASVSGGFSLWAEPDLADIGAQMRSALADPAEARRRTQRGAALLKAHFTWDKVAGRVLRSLAQTARAPAATARAAWTLDLVSTWKQRCGIATYSEHLTETDALSGHLSGVLTRDPIPADRLPGRKHRTDGHVTVNAVWNYERSGVERLAQAIREGRSDVLWFQHHPGHFSAADMQLVAAAAADSRYRVRAVTLHNVKELDRTLAASWLNGFDLVFVHTPADASILSKAGVRQPIVIPHGLLPLAAGPAEAAADRPFTVGTFGFLFRHKNVEVLVDAVARARAFLPDIRLKLLTCATSAEESLHARARVEAMIDYLDLAPNVSACFDFLEETEIVEQLAHCDLLAFVYGPSDESSTGAARVALMSGRPLLCTTSGALADLRPVSHVLPRPDPDLLAEALLSLHANRAALGLHDEERQKFIDSFSYQRIARRYIRHIETLLDDAHG